MKERYDVIISGGGLTGVAAALASKRNGVKDVLLIEKYGFLGGMATTGLVNPFMSYFKAREEYTEENQLVFGIFQETLNKLNELGGLNEKRIFDAEMMKLVLNRMIIEADINILFHTYVASVNKRNDNIIESVGITNKSGNFDIKGKVFIDCTGDADVAYMAGVPCKKGREEDGFSQPMTMCFRVAGVNRSKLPDRQGINEIYKDAVERGEITNPRENVLFFDTIQPDVIHFNTTRIVMKDATNAEELTQAELIAREQSWEMFYFLKKHIPGLENSYLQTTAPQIGIRESRRIVGRYILTEEDVLTGRKFNDSICYNAYSVDIHNPAGTGTIIKSLDKGNYYGIPYRCLLPINIDNLIVAGRPISSTHEAHSSLRIMPTCTAMGEAAGIAAALSIESDIMPNKVDVENLKEKLFNNDALKF